MDGRTHWRSTAGNLHTLSLEVPDDVYERLQHAAAESGQSVETLAVTWLSSNVVQAVDDPLEALIGGIDIAGIPWAEQHDAYIIDREFGYEKFKG